jgi:hypothetical protein
VTSPLQSSGQFTGTLTSAGANSQFDQPAGHAQSETTFTYALVDGVTGAFIRYLTPIAATPPTLQHDTTRAIVRQLSGLALGVVDTAAVDTIRHRVVLTMSAGGVSYPLGRYMFSGNTRALYSSGTLSGLTLLDEAFIVDQPVTAAFPFNRQPGAQRNCGALVTQLLGTNFPGIGLRLAGTPYATANSWSFGTSGMQIVQDLAKWGDYFPAWMGNDGLMHLIRSFDPATALPDFDWDRYPHVIADTVTLTDNLLTAPNRFVVVGNSMNRSTTAIVAPVVGRYDVPATAPHSIQNRGFVVPFIQQIQLDNPAQAQAVATAYGIRNTVYQTTVATTALDPRHDSWNVIRWQGVNWLELGWTMTLDGAGTMTHTMRKTYQ